MLLPLQGANFYKVTPPSSRPLVDTTKLVEGISDRRGERFEGEILGFVDNPRPTRQCYGCCVRYTAAWVRRSMPSFASRPDT